MTTKSTVLTVSQLTHAIKNHLESHFPDVTIQGEISNFKPHSSGHLYFDLKDAGAKVPAVLFRGARATLARRPKEGDQVIVKASLSVYPPHGKYQLIVRSLSFAGIGELLLKFEALKAQLKERGWFDPEHKKALPKFPKRIGVVTSPTGAVIRDIIHVLSRRFAGFQLLLNPVHVQGEGAAKEIAEAIEHFNRYQLADVLIVGRGGGSLEDLWAFNEERVAEAIFRSQIPIISAVGHETDVSLADFVADVRAPTPSAAAEIASSERAHHLEFLERTRQSLAHTLSHLVSRYRAQLEGFLRQPLLASPYGLLAGPMQRLDEVKGRLDQLMSHLLSHTRLKLSAHQRQVRTLQPTTQVVYHRQKVTQLDKSLRVATQVSLQRQRERLKQLAHHLAALDPKNVLKRGYSILFAEKTERVLTSARNLASGTSIRALLSDGEIQLKVTSHE